MFTQLRPAAVLFVFFTLLTGLLYPLTVTGAAQLIFPRQANGSLLAREGQVIGSQLIGQYFDDPRYFWGRPSATQPFPYNPASSGGSNWGPTSARLLAQVESRVAALRAADPQNQAAIPIDLVTASASGLDPHTSPAAAYYQAARVARSRGLALADVNRLIAERTEGRQWGLLGEPRVNVLGLNLALDGLQSVGQ